MSWTVTANVIATTATGFARTAGLFAAAKTRVAFKFNGTYQVHTACTTLLYFISRSPVPISRIRRTDRAFNYNIDLKQTIQAQIVYVARDNNATPCVCACVHRRRTGKCYFSYCICDLNGAGDLNTVIFMRHFVTAYSVRPEVIIIFLNLIHKIIRTFTAAKHSL